MTSIKAPHPSEPQFPRLSRRLTALPRFVVSREEMKSQEEVFSLVGLWGLWWALADVGSPLPLFNCNYSSSPWGNLVAKIMSQCPHPAFADRSQPPI